MLGETIPVLDRFHDSSMTALCLMPLLCALCLMIYALCFMLCALCFMLCALCFVLYALCYKSCALCSMLFTNFFGAQYKCFCHSVHSTIVFERSTKSWLTFGGCKSNSMDCMLLSRTYYFSCLQN